MSWSDWIEIGVALSLGLFGLGCTILVLLQLPGTWLLLGVALVIELVDGWWLPEPEITFGWPILLACTLLATLGEVIEFLAGVVGAKRQGATRRGMVGALIGGIVGAFAFTPLIPIPLFGTLVGAILGSFIGALAGEMSGMQARTFRESFGPALGAAWGRIWGTAGKLATGVAVWVWLTWAAF